MMRSMFSGVSGLRVHQTKMDVIANNISNVNTVGYKSSRVTFKEVFTQTLSGASAANPAAGRGGVNPMQVGLGVNVGSIDKLMTQGAAQRTDNTMDVMIQGDSFLIVNDESGTYFTRAGAMYLDEEGNLAMSGSDGLIVQGWKAEEIPAAERTASDAPGAYRIASGVAPTDIKIDGDYASMPAEVTTAVDYSGNLNAVTDPTKVTKVNFYDSLGNNYVLNVRFQYNTTSKLWDVQGENVMYKDGDTSKPVYIGANNALTEPPAAAPNPMGYVPFSTAVALQFDASGKLMATGATGSGTTGLTAGADGVADVLSFTFTGAGLSPVSTFGAIQMDFGGLTQMNTTADASALSDGGKAGTLNGTSLGSDGILTGRYSNGKTRMIAQVAVASFKNPPGLEKVGNNLFVTTANSGDYTGQAQTVAATGGSFIVGSLEMSNVDLSSEFTEMITTQRGFQANSRVITTSDELLQELVNLKR